MFAEKEIVQNSKDRLGFNIAFGIIDLDTFKAVEGIEKTGSLKAYSITSDLVTFDLLKIPIHKCTQEDKKKFYKPNILYER